MIVLLQNLKVSCDFFSGVRLTLSGGVRSMLTDVHVMLCAYGCESKESQWEIKERMKRLGVCVCVWVCVLCYVFMQSHRQKPGQYMLLKHHFPAVLHHSLLHLMAQRVRATVVFCSVSAGLQIQDSEPDGSQIYSQFWIKNFSTTFCYPVTWNYESRGGAQHEEQALCRDICLWKSDLIFKYVFIRDRALPEAEEPHFFSISYSFEAEYEFHILTVTWNPSKFLNLNTHINSPIF